MTNTRMKKAAMVLSISVMIAALSGQALAQQAVNPSSKANVITVASNSKNPYEVAGIDDPSAFNTFFAKLQKAVKANKPAEVANLISYPLNLNKDNKNYLIYTQAEFIKKYDRIFTSHVREILLAQKIDKLFVNYKGIMVGDGELWIGKSNNKLGVISVNVVTNPYEAAGIKNPIVFEHNFHLLQKNVKAGKKSDVAQLMVYPLKVNHKGKTQVIKSQKEFIASYDKIMTAKIKKALLTQKADQVGVNWKGVWIGNGELWIGQFGEQVGVFAINQ